VSKPKKQEVANVYSPTTQHATAMQTDSPKPVGMVLPKICLLPFFSAWWTPKVDRTREKLCRYILQKFMHCSAVISYTL